MKKRILSIIMVIALLATMMPQVAKAAPLSNIQGKTFFYLGSSITYGYAANGKSFVEYIAERNNSYYVKEAVSGTTLVDNGSSSYVARLKNNMDKNRHCDHFVCQLSTNDASQGKPLGTLSASRNLNDFDTSTIIGAMEYIVCYAKETWNCPVTFFTNPRYNNGNYQNMVNALYQVKEKWGVGVIDMWNDQNSTNIMNSSQKSVYMADDIHPNAAGYSEWWTPFFENYFQNYNYSVGGNAPIEVFGQVISSPSDNTIGVVWGQNDSMISNGQKYNVYVDGRKVLDSVICSYYEITGVEPGAHTIKITATLDGQETAGVTGEITVNGPSQTTTTTTTAKPIITYNGFEIVEAENFDYQSGVVIDTNSSASSGYNIGGINSGDYIEFEKINFSENAAGITFFYSNIYGDGENKIELYVDDMNNKVGEAVLANTGTHWGVYSDITVKLDKEISAGTHKLYVKFVSLGTASFVCNLDYLKFIKKSEYVETSSVKVTNDLEVYGFQISTTAQGIRTIYSSKNTIDNQAVTEIGLVYALVNGNYKESDLYVGSTSEFVASYAATNAGKLQAPLSKDNSYTMTMIFSDNKTASNYNSTYATRVYAKLANGEYVYSDVRTYSIYSIASNLYDNKLMNTFAAHNYLYNDILKVVDANYKEVNFKWSNSLAKPNSF